MYSYLFALAAEEWGQEQTRLCPKRRLMAGAQPPVGGAGAVQGLHIRKIIYVIVIKDRINMKTEL